MVDPIEERCKRFTYLLPEQRRRIILNEIRAAGLQPEIDPFQGWPLEQGMNIYTRIPTSSSHHQPVVVISAHYDGSTVNDNASGVFCLLHWLRKAVENQTNDSQVIFSFLDMEEQGQLGAKKLFKYLGSKPQIIRSFINIEGMNKRDTLILLESSINALSLLSTNLKSSFYLITDATYFKAQGIPAFDLFSGNKKEWDYTNLLSAQIAEIFSNSMRDVFEIARKIAFRAIF